MTLRLDTPGHVVVDTSAIDIGSGMYTILRQAVSIDLGLAFIDVEVRLGDSSFSQVPTAGRS